MRVPKETVQAYDDWHARVVKSVKAAGLSQPGLHLGRHIGLAKTAIDGLYIASTSRSKLGESVARKMIGLVSYHVGYVDSIMESMKIDMVSDGEEGK